MSFILDALKKSEIERQRQAVPGLMDSGTAPARTRLPRWALALAVLLAINLIVLVYVLRRGGAPVAPAARATPDAIMAAPNPAPAPNPAAAPNPATAPNPAAAPSAAAARHFSPLDGAPVYAPEIPAVDQPAAGVPERGSGEASVRTSQGRDPLLTDDKPEEVLPSISEVNLSGDQALPDLHLDVHVYATKPAERFVYINMRKYREGATLQEGPTLERIRRDGVVLNFQGVRFVLPRQQ
jgi:general secretion pathway protein B